MRNAMGGAPGTIADLIDAERVAGVAGRTRELALLERIAAPRGPVVAYLYGPYGIGKSSLLATLGARLAVRGIRCLHIAGGAVEPQPRAVVRALAETLGADCRTLADLAAALAADLAGRGRPVVLAIDDVDSLRLVETWLRRDLAPALPTGARLVLSGRAAPQAAWTAEYGDLFLPVGLRSLDRSAVLAQARGAGLGDTAAERVWEVSAGHPLSLRMALQAARTGTLDAAETAGELTEAILAGTRDPALRRMVEAAAVVRRVTHPLMAAMLNDRGLGRLDTFAALPFIQLDREGYLLGEPARQAVGTRLASLEPDRWAALRMAAARWITARLGDATPAERWRYMADLLYLVEHPQVRNAFFPPAAAVPPVEPAERGDFASIFTICEAQAGPDGRRVIESWARFLPQRFHVARGPAGEVRAFYVFAHRDDRLDGIAAEDPLLAAWRAHLERDRVPGGALFMRQLLTTEPGDCPPAWSACALDVKRAYFERWDLSRVYLAARPDVIAGPLMRRLGFQPLTDLAGSLPGSMVLDLPGAGLIGWISALVGVPPAGPVATGLEFARDSREVVVEGRTVRLTPLEAEVLAALIDRSPAVVTRDELIDTVWRRAYVGSNVVDAVVRTLRRKLGPDGRRVGTVPKAGYRFLAQQSPLRDGDPAV